MAHMTVIWVWVNIFNDQDMDRRFESLVLFTRAIRFGVLILELQVVSAITLTFKTLDEHSQQLAKGGRRAPSKPRKRRRFFFFFFFFFFIIRYNFKCVFG